MKSHEVLSCRFDAWYPKFKDITIESIIIPLDDTVIQYLTADGLVLPSECDDQKSHENNSEDSWDEDDSEVEKPHFPQLSAAICESIKQLGGAAFPKLTWSSPQDASWITMDNTLRCTSAADVYMLLKSSEFVSHDVTDAYCEDNTSELSMQHTLVLRKWIDVNPAEEFRCFVFGDTLVGISQRSATAHFSHLVELKNEIMTDVRKFFNKHIRGKFPENQYVFDITWKKSGSVCLLDFNPFGQTTDALLFSWEEDLQGDNLQQLLSNAKEKKLPELRCIESEAEVKADPYHCYRIPQDFVHLSAGEDPYKLIDFLNLKIQSGDPETDDSDS